MKGIFVPNEILNDDRLNSNEMFILSIYYYYTKEGEKHCCMLPNSEIIDMLHITERTFYRAKSHLKELGLITHNGGIKVWYGKLNDCQNDSGDCQNDSDVCQNDSFYCQNDSGDCQNDTHNKEEKNKKNKEEKSNFEMLWDSLPKEYKNDKYKTYIEEHYSGWIESINDYFGLDITGYRSNLKSMIFNVFSEEINSKEKKEIEDHSINISDESLDFIEDNNLSYSPRVRESEEIKLTYKSKSQKGKISHSMFG